MASRVHTSREKPLIVQSDHTIFLEVGHPDFKQARDRLMGFAELEKSPEYVHVYRITPVSLWNAAASGLPVGEILGFLEEFGKYPVPGNLRREIRDTIERFGILQLVADPEGEGFHLRSSDPSLLKTIAQLKHIQKYLLRADDEDRLPVRAEFRGHLKLALARLGYPVEDLAGYTEGDSLAVPLRDRLPGGDRFQLREYQRQAVEAFYAAGSARGGSGVVVLPCGAGKTVVGIGVLNKLGRQALILTTSVTAVRQWRRELLEKTQLAEESIGEYSGEVKQIRPITLSTYQMLTYRKSQIDEFEHFKLFCRRRWGLIIYDEVHLLPAPVFRFTAEIQSMRRLGLTATLIREDGKEAEVFSLIGPRKYDIPWRTLEQQGWIANADCVEIRVDLEVEKREKYLLADQRGKFRIASENPRKQEVVKSLVGQHRGDLVLVLGQYLDQLKRISRELDAPIITGKTASRQRDELYQDFRNGEIPILVVSKVGNFAVDLPDANVAIQISGTFGSRQEEAQRLGRILRPKRNGGPAVFYSIVTRGSRDQEFAEKRQLFLTEQGYRYLIRDWRGNGNDFQ